MKIVLLDCVFLLGALVLYKLVGVFEVPYGGSGDCFDVVKEVFKRREYGIADPYDYELMFVKPILFTVLDQYPGLLDYIPYICIAMVVIGKHFLFSFLSRQKKININHFTFLFYANPFVYTMILSKSLYCIDFLLIAMLLYSITKTAPAFTAFIAALLVYQNPHNIVFFIPIYTLSSFNKLKFILTVLFNLSVLLFASYTIMGGSWVSL